MGDEPEDVVRWALKQQQDVGPRLLLQLRFNTFYPEVSGGHFINRHLFAEAQLAIHACGLQIINAEYFEEIGVVPRVVPGDIEPYERYLLYDGSRIAGQAMAWQVLFGLFEQDIFLAMIIEPSLGAKIVRSLQRGFAGKARCVDATAKDAKLLDRNGE